MNYQEKQALAEEQQQPEGANFAYIGTVLEDGVTLRWTEDGAESKKSYKVNRSCVFLPGDKVRIFENSGTYTVEYPVGNPITELVADHAKTAKTAESADNATNAETAKHAETATATNYIISVDDQYDRLRLTYNPYKQVFAIISNRYTGTWRDFA